MAGVTRLALRAGEWGYTSAQPPCSYGNRVDRPTQAKYLLRQWYTLLLVNGGVKGTASIYCEGARCRRHARSHSPVADDWKNDGDNVGDCESNFGR
jgi:hypothetical protein